MPDLSLSDDVAVGRRHLPPVPPLRGLTWPEAARELENLWRHLVDDWSGKPGLHASTHLGGSDNLVSGQTPTGITLGSTGSAGSPAAGVAAIDHAHPTTALEVVEDLKELLETDGLPVTDPKTRRLLEAILMTLGEVVEEVRRLKR